VGQEQLESSRYVTTELQLKNTFPDRLLDTEILDFEEGCVSFIKRWMVRKTFGKFFSCHSVGKT